MPDQTGFVAKFKQWVNLMEMVSSIRLAVILNKNPRTIKRWATAGIIPGVKPGGKTGQWLFNVTDVLNKMKKQEPNGNGTRK